MKQLLISILTLFSFSFCYAQLEKGTRLIQGSFNVGGNSRTDEFNPFFGGNEFESRNNFLTVAPSIGWFTGNNTLAGFGLSYEHNSNKGISFFNGGQSETISRNNLFGFNFFFTRFNPLVDKLYLTTTINFSAGGGTEVFENGADQERVSNVFQVGFNIVPGLTYFISDKWAIQASIGRVFYQYRQANLKDSNPTSTNKVHNYGLNFSANTYLLGFQYFLSRKGG